MDNFTYNANFSSNSNYLRCMAEDGIIYAIDMSGKQAVGFTNDKYNALEETTVEYYNKLVELGAIIPEKSQEEINAELQQALKESQAVNLEMLQLLKELKGGKDNVQSDNNKSDSKAVPKQSGGNQQSNKSSKSSDTGSN